MTSRGKLRSVEAVEDCEHERVYWDEEGTLVCSGCRAPITTWRGEPMNTERLSCEAPWCENTFKPNGAQRYCRNRDCQSRRLRERLIPDFQPGDEVIVRCALGYWLEKRAVSRWEPGHTFPIVRVAWRDDLDDDEGAAFPLEDVRWDGDDIEGDVLSHDQYRERMGLERASL